MSILAQSKSVRKETINEITKIMKIIEKAAPNNH